jgi:hypothetical protein
LGALTDGPFGFEDRSREYPGAQTSKAGQTVILIDPLHVPGNRYFERIEGLFEAVVASGVERLPADRRYARRQQLGDTPRAARLTYRQSGTAGARRRCAAHSAMAVPSGG